MLDSAENTHTLNTIVAAIHIVTYIVTIKGTFFFFETHEEIICLGCTSADAKKLQQVMELAMYIAHDGDRRCDLVYICILTKRLARTFAQMPYFYII